MKRFAMIVAIAMLAGMAFAQEQGPAGPPSNGGKGGPQMAPERAQPIDWKVGTVVTTEYKKVTGTINFTAGGPPKFSAEGVDYVLRAPHHDLEGLISGDSLTVEGTFTTVKAEKSYPALARAFKLTIKGKEIDVRGEHKPPMGGNGPQGPGPQGEGPDDGPDSQ